MGVYIKGMEMPKIENYKSVKAEIRQIDGKLELGIMTGGYYCSQEWTYYPLVEVPTPHGRLIDADALADYFDLLMAQHRPFNAFELIMDAPTIIEEER